MADNDTAPRSLSVRPEDAEVLDQRLSFNVSEWNVMKMMANEFIASGCLPATIKNAAQAIVIMQAGKEIGLQPMYSLQNLFFVHGRLGMYSQVLLALMQRNGVEVDWKTLTPDKVEAVFTYKKRPAVKIAFGKDDQARAKLSGDNYSKYPQDMYVARVISRAAKFFPDLIGTTIEAKEVLEDLPALEAGPSSPSAPQVEAPRELPKPKDLGKEKPAAAPADGSQEFRDVMEYLNNASEKSEVADVINNMVKIRSWTGDEAKKINGHIVATLKRIEGYNAKPAPKAEVVDLAAAAKDVFPTGEVTRETREEMLEDMKSQELDPLVKKISDKSPSAMKKREKIDLILSVEFPSEQQTAIPVPAQTPIAPAPVAEAKKNSILDDLFSAGQ